MTIVAMFGIGRILLHLLAALGDGCFRFHGAGIMRELGWVVTAATLLTRMSDWLRGELVHYLAKQIKSATAEPSGKVLRERGAR